MEFTTKEEINGSLDWKWILSTEKNHKIKSAIKVKFQRIIKKGKTLKYYQKE